MFVNRNGTANSAYNHAWAVHILVKRWSVLTCGSASFHATLRKYVLESQTVPLWEDEVPLRAGTDRVQC